MENTNSRVNESDKTRQWQRHLERWQKSGQSRTRYCREHGLKRHTFYYWNKKLSGPDGSRLRLVPLAVPAQAPLPQTDQADQVACRRQLQVTVGMLILTAEEGIEPSVLKGLVRALVEVTCGV